MTVGLFVGLATLDVVQLVDRLPSEDGKTTARRSWLAAGGPAAVAAITFAALGGSARLVTVLGTGPAADVVRADLASAGVEVVDAAPPGFGIAASVALVERGTGRRAVVSGSGHRPATLSWPAGPVRERVLLLDGHHPELALPAAEQAARAGVPVVVDAGSHKPVFDRLWPLATDVICSADYTHPEGLAPAALLANGPGLVAVSDGAGPVRWWAEGSAGELPVPAVEVRDTLGAGDVLHGSYAFALARGVDRVAALRFAVAAASRRVTTPGPFAWRDDLAVVPTPRPGSAADPPD